MATEYVIPSFLQEHPQYVKPQWQEPDMRELHFKFILCSVAPPFVVLVSE